ncbi:MAG: 50S ribosomal protein L9 [Proteobacteria bacterium]|nr:50S ribosomal protein L9 [Pseudomonadota bacterium]MCH9758838.1 50S ribosomal protein L9 [Pseudomonadota bacterium]
MKVILLEKIAAVGNLGDVINVRPGYARNYLFPQGKAERANEGTIAQFEQRRAELQKRQDELEATMQSANNALDGYLLQLTSRASPDGNLYGSITPQMIASALNAQQLVAGIAIKRGQITVTDGHIKALGEHEAVVRLNQNSVANIKISILAENTSPATEEAKNDKSKKDSQ